jgi:dienelactone hydrolase
MFLPKIFPLLGSFLALTLASIESLPAETPRPLRDLNAYFPFAPVPSHEAWQTRRAEIEQRVLLASGLWPMPEKTPLNAVIHGRIERDDYTIDRVFFESLPGHFVTGSLYRPKSTKPKMPAVLCPHGHWPNGRFMDLQTTPSKLKAELDSGAEQLECAARSPLQARCVQLARMGCVTLLYDMLGNADSLQFPEHRHGAGSDGFLSPSADLRLQTFFGLQTWNSVRALDFLLSLEGVDPDRVACTGASGGGTQTMMLTAIDPRIKAAFPCVMVSTAMQGGCTCENAHYLRINQGNIDIAALTAPRPLGITSANDWTKEVDIKGLPDLKNLFSLLGAPDHVSAHLAPQFPHNYNLHSRTALYHFLNRHFQLGLPEPIQEREFTFPSREESTVWSGTHPAPSGSQSGPEHEKAVCAWMRSQDAQHIDQPLQSKDPAFLKNILAPAWSTIVGRSSPQSSEVQFEASSSTETELGVHIVGTAENLTHQESVPLEFWIPKFWKGAFTVLAHDPSEAVQRLTEKALAAGIAVAHPTLYLAGATEQPKAGDNLKAKFDGSDYREFSGYTFGYNPPLAVRRAHDLATVIAVLKAYPSKPVNSLTLSVGKNYSAAALIAGASLAPQISEVELEDDSFRFANLTHPWHPDFVPGAVKYGDVEGLKLLCPSVRSAAP